MEHINIIAKEAVTAVPFWIAAIGTVVSILLILSTFIYWRVVHDPFKIARYLAIVGVIALSVALGWHAICCMWFKTPTGEYRYEAIIDKENMTIAEYEEFIDTYHPVEKDGKYYFEGKVEK